MRGPKGTTVVLTISRGGGTPFDVEIERAVIIQPEVEARELAGGDRGLPEAVGLLRPRRGPAGRGARRPTSRPGKQKLILDLRGNPGGFVTAAREIASQFLADGTVFWQRDADGNLIETVAKPGGQATDPSIKLVVLVDGGSASASEIVAAALHDRGRATLVGTKTYRQGHGPAVDPARGRQRRVPADDRPVAHAGPDLDPREGDRAGRHRRPRRPPGRATIRSSTPALKALGEGRARCGRVPCVGCPFT